MSDQLVAAIDIEVEIEFIFVRTTTSHHNRLLFFYFSKYNSECPEKSIYSAAQPGKWPDIQSAVKKGYTMQLQIEKEEI